MNPWPLDRFEALSRRSHALHGNKHVLPIAMAAIETGLPVVTSPEVVVGLSGRTPANRALEALERLCTFGAMYEHPYMGRPAPRRFELRPSPYWASARTLAEEAWPAESRQSETEAG